MVSEGEVPSWAAETACSRAFFVLVVGFCENACAALVALAALDTTPPTMTGKAELCTALELAVDEIEVTELDGVTIGGTDADEDAENEVVAGCVPPDDGADDAEVDDIGSAVLEGEIGVLSVDDGGMMLDEGTLDEEATPLDVICRIEGVLEATILLKVAVAVQYTDG